MKIINRLLQPVYGIIGFMPVSTLAQFAYFDQACTSFCLDNNGYAIYGTNYDYVKDRHHGLVFVNKRQMANRLLQWGPSPGVASSEQQSE